MPLCTPVTSSPSSICRTGGFCEWSEMTVSRILFRLLKLPPRLLYAIGLGNTYGRLVLLLATRGRRTGKPRVTPLQYEQVDGTFIIASARGTRATGSATCSLTPMSRCKCADPTFPASPRPVSRLGVSPTFSSCDCDATPGWSAASCASEVFRGHPDRSQLEEYASNLAMVTIAPSAPPGLAEPQALTETETQQPL